MNEEDFDIGADAIRAHLRTVLASPPFLHSQRQQKLLSYLVEAMLADNGARVNQYAIAIDVFGRDASFDTTTDSIVRVEVSRLRSKLHEYYTMEGVDERLRIELPKGQYVPSIIATGAGNDPGGPRAIPHAEAVTRVPPGDTRGRESRPDAVSAFQRRPAVAVLPFSNVSGDPEQEVVADGLTEDIITKLALFRWFPVVSRNSCFAYKGKPQDMKRIREELGVRYVVTGSARLRGDRLRINAELIDAENDAHLWAEQFDRSIGDLFAVQDEIAAGIAARLSPQISRAEQDRIRIVAPSDLDAWGLLHRGRWHQSRLTKQDLDLAIDLFESASECDPNWAPPRGALAGAHIWDAVQGWSSDPTRSLELAMGNARTALAIDPLDSSARAGLAAAVLFLTHDHARARKEAEQATSLNPSDPLARFVLAVVYAFGGEPAKAVQEAQLARRLSPHDPAAQNLTIESLAHFLLRDFDAAIEAARRALDENPNLVHAHNRLVAALAAHGRMAEARAAADELREVNPGFRIEGLQRFAYKHEEDRDFFESMLRSAGLE